LHEKIDGSISLAFYMPSGEKHETMHAVHNAPLMDAGQPRRACNHAVVAAATKAGVLKPGAITDKKNARQKTGA